MKILHSPQHAKYVEEAEWNKLQTLATPVYIL